MALKSFARFSGSERSNIAMPKKKGAWLFAAPPTGCDDIGHLDGSYSVYAFQRLAKKPAPSFCRASGSISESCTAV